MDSELKPHVDKIMKESNSPFEAMFGVLMLYMVHYLFKMVEVIIDFGDH